MVVILIVSPPSGAPSDAYAHQVYPADHLAYSQCSLPRSRHRQQHQQQHQQQRYPGPGAPAPGGPTSRGPAPRGHAPRGHSQGLSSSPTSVSLLSSLSSQVDADSQLTTNKEEEWVTKKKTEVTTKKQIETRVKRHVVLEDGKVVDDSGPIVTTNTTEDTEKQEHQHTEHRTHGDDPASEANRDAGWDAVELVAPGAGGRVKEVKERKVKSRQETEERVETEDIQHLGDIADEDYLAAVRDRRDVRRALLSSQQGDSRDRQLALASGPRVVHQSSKGRKVIDTEDTHEVSEVQPDGRVVTEKRRTTEHEEVDEKEDPDDGEIEEDDKHRESSHRFRKSKDQEVVEYVADGVKIGEEMRYQVENVEGERLGDPRNLDADVDGLHGPDWDSLSTRIRRMRRHKLLAQRAAVAGPGGVPADRKDALTKRPLDFDQEEETRKVETSKWLENHFGSESRSSKDSIEDEDDVQKGTTTSFINVTMKSRPVGTSTPLGTPHANGHPHSSSRVFVSSPEPESSGYFQGVSEWSERQNENRESSWKKKSTFSPSDPTSAVIGSPAGAPGRPDRVQVLPTGPDHTFKASSAWRTQPQYRGDSDDQTNGRSHYTHHANTAFIERERRQTGWPVRSPGGGPRASSPRPPSPPHRKKSQSQRLQEEDDGPAYRGVLSKKESFRSWGRDVRDGREPAPDYSPPRPPSPSPSPPPMPANKKLYQRTRFAADIPAPSTSPTSRSNNNSNGKSQQQSASQIIGDSFRKLVGKFRSGSSERKKDKAGRRPSGSGGKVRGSRSRGSSPARPSSRSPSPTYRPADGSLLGRKKKSFRRGGDADGSSPNDETEGGDSPEEVQPVAPPRHGGPGARTLRRDSVRLEGARTPIRRSVTQQDSSDRDVVDGEQRSATRKYYLGEDPFGGSIYGREREYDGVVPARRRQRRRGSQSEEERDSALGRLSKSTSRLTTAGSMGTTQHNTLMNGGSARRQSQEIGQGGSSTYYTGRGGRGGSQTLPRKLRDDSASRTKKQVYVTKSNVERSSPGSQVWETRFSRDPRSSLTSPLTGSLINVSFVNQVTPPASTIGISRSNGVTWDPQAQQQGPAKPARTYRTSLTRSKSFNVQAGPTTYLTPAKSNSHLHRLEESPPPLKSPGILASISRSQRDLSEAVDKENVALEDLYTKPRKSSSSQLNGVHHNQDQKKKVFLRGLLDRAPELFKTLHPEEQESREVRTPGRVHVIDYSNSFRSSNTATPPPRSPYRPDRSSPSGGAPKSVLTSKVHTPSFRRDANGTVSVTNNNGVHTTVMRRGSGSRDSDDFSETVRITSKSTDPLRPSVTNTLQSYSKKTVPSNRDGRDRIETIETSETSTVTKSRYRGGSGDSGVDTSSSSGVGAHSRFILDADAEHYSKYPRHASRHADAHAANGGVVIEVRNTRK